MTNPTNPNDRVPPPASRPGTSPPDRPAARRGRPPGTPNRRKDTDSHERLRAARASLAFLFEPGSPQLRDYLTSGDPLAAYEKFLDSPAQPRGLRPELQRLHPAEVAHRTDASLAETRHLGIRIVIPEDPEWPPGIADLALTRHAIPATNSSTDSDPTNSGTTASTTLSTAAHRTANTTASPAASPAGDAVAGLAVLCLFVHGATPLDRALRRAVAVTGGRAATPLGTRSAFELAFGCAHHGWIVVTGRGYGIDSAAHQGAVHGGGQVVEVVPSGLDQPMPADQPGLFTDVGPRGLRISMQPAGALVSRTRSVAAHRLVAALAVGTVLVEAPPSSGSLHSLRHAIALGRPAMVMPGPVTSVMAAGGHQALRHHPQTRLVTGAHDVLADLLGTSADPSDRTTP